MVTLKHEINQFKSKLFYRFVWTIFSQYDCVVECHEMSSQGLSFANILFMGLAFGCLKLWNHTLGLSFWPKVTLRRPVRKHLVRCEWFHSFTPSPIHMHNVYSHLSFSQNFSPMRPLYAGKQNSFRCPCDNNFPIQRTM